MKVMLRLAGCVLLIGCTLGLAPKKPCEAGDSRQACNDSCQNSTDWESAKCEDRAATQAACGDVVTSGTTKKECILKDKRSTVAFPGCRAPTTAETANGNSSFECSQQANYFDANADSTNCDSGHSQSPVELPYVGEIKRFKALNTVPVPLKLRGFGKLGKVALDADVVDGVLYLRPGNTNTNSWLPLRDSLPTAGKANEKGGFISLFSGRGSGADDKQGTDDDGTYEQPRLEWPDGKEYHLYEIRVVLGAENIVEQSDYTVEQFDAEIQLLFVRDDRTQYDVASGLYSYDMFGNETGYTPNLKFAQYSFFVTSAGDGDSIDEIKDRLLTGIAETSYSHDGGGGDLDFLPHVKSGLDVQDFYIFEGSRSYGDCAGGLTQIVRREPFYVSKKAIEQLGERFPAGAAGRPVQRRVDKDDSVTFGGDYATFQPKDLDDSSFSPNYYDKDAWTTAGETCTYGSSQSPIEIDSSALIIDDKQIEGRNAFTWDNFNTGESTEKMTYFPVRGEGDGIGTAIAFSKETELGISSRGYSFRLKTLHMKAGEHSFSKTGGFGSDQYPYELQLTFENKQSIEEVEDLYDNGEFNSRDGTYHKYVVISVPVQAKGGAAANEINKFQYTKFGGLPIKKATERTDNAIDYREVRVLFKTNDQIDLYYSYTGSLTAPPCDQNVIHFVFGDAITMPLSEVTGLQASAGRPLQDAGERTSYQPAGCYEACFKKDTYQSDIATREKCEDENFQWRAGSRHTIWTDAHCADLQGVPTIVTEQDYDLERWKEDDDSCEKMWLLCYADSVALWAIPVIILGVLCLFFICCMVFCRSKKAEEPKDRRAPQKEKKARGGYVSGGGFDVNSTRSKGEYGKIEPETKDRAGHYRSSKASSRHSAGSGPPYDADTKAYFEKQIRESVQTSGKTLKISEDDFVNSSVDKILPVWGRKSSKGDYETKEQFWGRSQTWIDNQVRNYEKKGPGKASADATSSTATSRTKGHYTSLKNKTVEVELAPVKASPTKSSSAERPEPEDQRRIRGLTGEPAATSPEQIRRPLVRKASTMIQSSLQRGLSHQEINEYLKNKGMTEAEIEASKKRAQRLKGKAARAKIKAQAVVAFRKPVDDKLRESQTSRPRSRGSTADLGIDITKPTDV